MVEVLQTAWEVAENRAVASMPLLMDVGLFVVDGFWHSRPAL